MRATPVVLLCALLQVSCALTDLEERVPSQLGAPDVRLIETRLILIGDAGHAVAGDPVLRALSMVAGEAPGRTTVVFLGDNIYPRGLPTPDHEDFAESVARLDVQLDAVSRSGAAGLLVPGNHDYSAGANAISRQARHTLEYSAGAARLVPAGECPGPVFRDLGRQVRLIAIDTEWLLRGYPDASCQDERAAQHEPQSPARPEPRFHERLSQLILGAGERWVVVAGHHPLATNGLHGGFLPVEQHLFPLTLIPGLGWLYVPLPGFLYTVPRARGWLTDQDLRAGAYRDMSRKLIETLGDRPRLILAGGHEHSIQVLELETGARSGLLQIVSGAGSIRQHTPVGWAADSLAATPHAGFVVLDWLEGPVRAPLLGLVEVIEYPDFDSRRQGPVKLRRSYRDRLWEE